MERNEDLRTWFSLSRLPFQSNLKPEELYMRKSFEEISSKLKFAIDSSFYYMIIGDVGAGKSCSMDYAISKLDNKCYEPIKVIAGQWTFTELLRQIMRALNSFTRTGQQSTMLKAIGDAYSSCRESGKLPVLFIDEASLLNAEVFQQLHLLSMLNCSSNDKPVPMVLCGQELLFDKASGPLCKSFLSRIMHGSKLTGFSMTESKEYMIHQIKTLCKCSNEIFEDNAYIAVHQASAGIPRIINTICLKAMHIAMERKETFVSSDMVRLASENWWR